MDYTVITVKDKPEHAKLQNRMTSQLWPEFMLNDPVSNQNWPNLFEEFPEFQFSMVNNDEIIGIANSIPFFWGEGFEKLPEQGWDWAIQKGFIDKSCGIKPNVLCGLQITTNGNYRGKGISSNIVQEMKAMAKGHGYRHLIIPVRPSIKSKYPLIPMDNYINWQREDGLPFDPWIRVHVQLGGRIIKVCHRAMYIPGTIGDWEEWTRLRFKESGQYVVEGALNTITADVPGNIAEYIEPNVWIAYDL